MFLRTGFLLALAASIVQGPTGAKIDEFMTRLEGFGYSGALLVAKNGEVIVHKAYGWRDAQRRLPYTTDTVADIGSITKQFTAAAILALEEEGKLSTSDPMAKYFRDVPPDKQAITLHQLLTHSAGFPGEIGDDDEAIGREAFVKRALSTKLLFAPGTGYEYSNVGYSLLGAIVELVTGGPYERYLHDRLFARAGMEQTGYVIPKWDRLKLAPGVLDGRPWGTALDRPWAADGPYWNLRANGGILSTPADMYRWSVALDGGKVLSAAWRKKLFTPFVREGTAPSSYAYGWAIFPMPNGHTLVAHNGGNGVFAADFRRYVDDGVVLFIASNVSDKPSTAVSRFVGRLALATEVAMPPKVVPLPAETLRKLEGNYDGVLVKATPEGGLALTPTDAASFARLYQRVAGADEASKRSQAFADRVVKGEGLNERQLEMKQRLEAKNGPLKGATLIGSRSERQRIASVVRLDLERGHVYLQLAWEGGERPLYVRISDAMPSAVYLPVSATEFASYDFGSGETAKVRFAEGKLVVAPSS
jgi:CubicO group peptidase (beta-lactamase class C family)